MQELVHTHAWLNLWNKHIATGRINQVDYFIPSDIILGVDHICILYAIELAVHVYYVPTHIDGSRNSLHVRKLD